MTADTEMDMAACMTVANVWISRNVAAFPIAISKNGKGYAKRPLTPHGHADATLDKSTANELFALASMDLREGEVLGVGIVPGPAGYAVADLDVHGDGKNGVQAADDLLMGIENTYAPVTISGGAHAWFTKPDPDQHITNGSPWARLGIDIRGDNGWTVAPGTITPWGSWAPITGTPTFDAIKPFPESLWNELVAHQRNGKVKVNLPTGPLPNPGDVALGDQLAGLLSDLGPWPDGDGEHRDRSRRFHYLVGEIKRHGHSIEDTTAVLTPWCNALDKYTGRVPEMVAASWAKVDGPPNGTGEEAADADPTTFWSLRPELGHLHDYARARRASPWAVLGTALVRVTCAVGPTLVLPPIIGGPASLNMFAALVGPSGAGKDAAESAAAEALDLTMGSPFTTLRLGSGEGIAHSYVRGRRGNHDLGEPPRVIEQHTVSVLFVVPEVDTLAALGDRRGATLMPELRDAWTGKQLGFAYADPEKRLPVGAHAYRMGLVLGVQPSRAGALLNDREGGTPQRFMWLPAVDTDAPDVAPAEPVTSWDWRSPALPRSDARGLRVMSVCAEAWEAIDRAALERLRGHRDALDGHALLARLKIAAALALLAGRAEVTSDDWALSDRVMRVSDRTRASVLDQLNRDQSESNKRRGEAEGERAAIASEVMDKRAQQRVARKLTKALSEATGWLSHAELRRVLASRDRHYFDAAIAALVTAGQATEETVDYQGQPGHRYRIGGGKS